VLALSIHLLWNAMDATTHDVIMQCSVVQATVLTHTVHPWSDVIGLVPGVLSNT
jgi:hypothetical protein